MIKSRLFLLFILIAAFSPCRCAAQSITVFSHELKPFTWQESGEVRGLAYDMITAVMMKMDMTPEIKLVPFTRGLYMVQNGRNTALFHVQRTPDRESTMKWVGPIITNGVYIYHLKSSPHAANTLDDLRTLKHIAVVTNDSSDEFFTKRGFTNLVRVRQQSQCLEMLAAGRVQAAPFGELVIGAYARDQKIDISMVRKSGIRLFESALYMGFSKEIPDEVIAKWQRSLDEVKREKYETLYKKYITEE